MALSNTPSPAFSPTHSHPASLVWLRRDLRLYDHTALSHALSSSKSVWVVFVFDTTILEPLKESKSDAPTADRRVDFIWQGISQIDAALRKQGGGLIVRYGKPAECIPKIATELGVSCVMVNHDYEPSAINRDAVIASSLKSKALPLKHSKTK
jgi:deoxyribodipyrimidine photo-lyase